MPMTDAFLPEFDQEMATTRRVLERVPEDKLGWTPHPKSFTLGSLATHLATLPGWTVETFSKDELDVVPDGQEFVPPKVVESREELLSRFDESVAKGRAALAGASDAAMFQNWTLLKGGEKVMTLPRVAVLRAFVLSHTIHHRAQMSVYLRLLDVPVPSIYGPSADESPF